MTWRPKQIKENWLLLPKELTWDRIMFDIYILESCFPVTDGLYTDQMYEDLSVPVYTTLKGVS